MWKDFKISVDNFTKHKVGFSKLNQSDLRKNKCFIKEQNNKELRIL